MNAKLISKSRSLSPIIACFFIFFVLSQTFSCGGGDGDSSGGGLNGEGVEPGTFDISQDGSGEGLTDTSGQATVSAEDSPNYDYDIEFQIKDESGIPIPSIRILYSEGTGIITAYIYDGQGKYEPAVVMGDPQNLANITSSAREHGGSGNGHIVINAVTALVVIGIVLAAIGVGLGVYEIAKGIYEVSNFVTDETVSSNIGLYMQNGINPVLGTEVVFCKTLEEIVQYYQGMTDIGKGIISIALSAVTLGKYGIANTAIQIGKEAAEIGSGVAASAIKDYLIDKYGDVIAAINDLDEEDDKVPFVILFGLDIGSNTGPYSTIVFAGPPFIKITDPMSGSTLSGSCTVEALSCDSDGITDIELQVDEEGFDVWFSSTDPSNPNYNGIYQTQWETTYVSDGNHSISAKAIDSNSETKTSAEVPVVVNNQGGVANTPPTTSITSPSDISTYTEGDSITFSGSGSDAEDGTLTGTSLVWTSSIDGEIGTGTSFTRDDLSVGMHTITLTATDSDGATGSDSVGITVNPVGNTLPTASITSPSDGGTYTEGDTISFSGTGNDAEDGTLTGSSLVWTSSIDGEIGTGTSFTRSDLSVGTHTITLTATDSEGATGSDSVSITISSAGTYPDTVIDTIPVGDGPVSVAVTPNGSHVYVTNYADDTVSVIQTSDNTVVDTISVGNGPYAIAVTPNGSYVYVANSYDTVSVIQTSDNTVVDTIPLGELPRCVAVTPNGSYVYVTIGNEDTVSVIQTSDNTVVDTISVGKGPRCVAVTPNGSHVYVANRFDGTVSVIQTSDNTVVDTISVGNGPYAIAVTPNGSYVYVANYFDGTVSVIQTSDNTVIDTISVGNGSYHAIAVTPNGSYVYVTNVVDDTVSVIQTSDNTVVDTIPLGEWPRSVAVTPDGSHVYVTNSGDDTVSVIGFSES